MAAISRKTHLLTHLPLVPHICVGELGQHRFRQWLVACSVPSHYLNQCYCIVDWTIMNKLQWNSNQNKIKFIQKMCLKLLYAKWWPFCPGGDKLNTFFLNENVRISIEISLKFVPRGLINNIPALVQIMAWHRPGNKPLSGPMMKFTDAYMRHSASMN